MREVAGTPLLRVTALLALLTLLSACERGGQPPDERGRMDDGGPGAVETLHAGLRIGLVLAPSEGESFEMEAIRAASDELRELADPEVASVRILGPPNERFRRDELILLAEEGLDLVCTVGPDGRDDLTELAAIFPTTQFCLLDAELPSEAPANAFAITWRTVEGGFLAGAAAALATHEAGVGIVVGATERMLEPLRVGFEAGARQARPGVPVVVITATNARGEEDQRVARDAARGQYGAGAAGARALLPFGGRLTLLGVAQGAATSEGAIVGWEVDVTRLLTDQQDGHVLVSVVKRFDVALLAAVRHAAAGGPPQVVLRVADGAFGILPGKDPRYPLLAPRLDQLAAELTAGRLALPG
ncbi:MAG: BMP family ABC transporter substrate-binding protein [Nitriliruptorales bacterium]